METIYEQNDSYWMFYENYRRRTTKEHLEIAAKIDKSNGVLRGSDLFPMQTYLVLISDRLTPNIIELDPYKLPKPNNPGFNTFWLEIGHFLILKPDNQLILDQDYPTELKFVMNDVNCEMSRMCDQDDRMHYWQTVLQPEVEL